jgi:hypothetical protein
MLDTFFSWIRLDIAFFLMRCPFAFLALKNIEMKYLKNRIRMLNCLYEISETILKNI